MRYQRIVIPAGGRESVIAEVARQSPFAGERPFLRSGPIPDDGLCRITLSCRAPEVCYLVYGDQNPETVLYEPGAQQFDYTAFVAEVVRRTCGETARCWCVGHLRDRICRRCQEGRGHEFRCATMVFRARSRKVLLADPIPAREETIETVPYGILAAFPIDLRSASPGSWPGFQYQEGAHIYVFTGPRTALEASVEEMVSALERRDPDVIGMWRGISQWGMNRSDVTSACSQMKLWVTPGGSDFDDASFHSIALSADEIIDAIRGIAMEGDNPLTVIDEVPPGRADPSKDPKLPYWRHRVSRTSLSGDVQPQYNIREAVGIVEEYLLRGELPTELVQASLETIARSPWREHLAQCHLENGLPDDSAAADEALLRLRLLFEDHPDPSPELLMRLQASRRHYQLIRDFLLHPVETGLFVAQLASLEQLGSMSAAVDMARSLRVELAREFGPDPDALDRKRVAIAGACIEVLSFVERRGQRLLA